MLSLNEKLSEVQLLRSQSSCQPGGKGAQRVVNKVFYEEAPPKVQPITLLYTTFDKKVTP